MFPETSGRTLEELAFSECLRYLLLRRCINSFSVFEGKEVQKRQAKETEQELIHGHISPPMQLKPRNGSEVKEHVETGENKQQ